MTDSPRSNLQELSVSELSQALKRTIETVYDRVRVRGELGRVTVARSGHMYADIKDDKAVLNTVMWKGQVNRLPFRPEEGLEVIATGRLSTYPGRSNYQLIAEEMRPAGLGALMALLEDRKKKLAAEGLFDAAHKKPLPYLPETIGVVTSPTGAVIRDILHRIRDRFPCRVIVWPALVQGDAACDQIVAGLHGFNALPDRLRPDVLIVGRGGGSIEDLWPFNEEAVVRAAFASDIPVISAVGHETDTTLLDYVADARAPTPTGAAEIAVPVLTELQLKLKQTGLRQTQSLHRLTRRAREKLDSRHLPGADRLLDQQRQRIDYLSSRLPHALLYRLQRERTRLERQQIAAYAPGRRIQDNRSRLAQLDGALARSLQNAVSKQRLSFSAAASRLRAEPLQKVALSSQKDVKAIWSRAQTAIKSGHKQFRQKLSQEAKLLEALSYQATLSRGYVLIRAADDQNGRVIRNAETARSSQRLMAQFEDGTVFMRPEAAATVQHPPSARAPTSEIRKKPAKSGQDQGDLF